MSTRDPMIDFLNTLADLYFLGGMLIVFIILALGFLSLGFCILSMIDKVFENHRK